MKQEDPLSQEIVKLRQCLGGEGASAPSPADVEALAALLAEARAALETSDRQFKAVFATSQDAMVILDDEGFYRDANPAACALYARPREEILSARVGSFTARPSSAHAWSALSAQSAGEWQVMRPDGSRRQVEFVSAPFAAGRRFAVIRDITERKHGEDRLRESEWRMRAVLDAALDAVIAIDASQVITYWNPRAEAIFGWSRADAIGSQMSHMIIPERYREAHDRGLARYLATGEGQVIGKRLELVGLRRDGTEFPLELSLAALKHGETHSFSAFIADLTERKRAEADLRRYAEVFRNAQVGLNLWCLKDADDPRSFTLISTNPAAVESLGVRAEDILGKRIDEAFPLMRATDLSRLYREVLATGQGRDLGEVRYGENEDAELFSVRVFPVPPDCVGVALENITERRHLEEQLRQSQRLEAIGRLAGGIAHDFNNLMSVVLGQSERLLGRLDRSDPAFRRVEEIRTAGERATALTRQLLAFSRQQVLTAQVLDPGEVIRDISTMLHRLIGEECVLRTVVPRDSGRVRADRGHIEQVIVNLVVNARDAMPGGGTITLTLAQVNLGAADAPGAAPAPPGRYVLLSVADTGTGMDAPTRDRVFEPFFTTKDKAKGTGLGLATVYGIVKQSGGYIGVSSEPGKGATFSIYLPLAEGTVAASERSNPLHPVPPGNETVLLVEDEEMLRALGREMLEGSGYVVLDAASGEEAIRVAAAHEGPIHLLLTDVVMPGMNGRMLAEKLAPVRPEMKVLFASGYTDDVVFQRGVLSQGTAFLQKPFTAAALERKVREILDAGPGASGSA